MDLKTNVTSKVLSVYDKLPACGKPRDDEYTVLAAVVAQTTSTSSSAFFVVALATGTKCIGPECLNNKGCLLSDSHGEILAKRCFSRYLADWITSLIEQPQKADLEDCPFQWNSARNDTNSKLSIKVGWKFHLYISDCPCGDASIYASNLITLDGINPTGAKLIPSGDCKFEATELPGSLRTKSGRSDIKAENRTTSMSCSDKVCRWSFLGLQGALLSLWMNPVHLSSLIVDQDPSTTEEAQKEALQRALHTRVFPTSSRSEDVSKVHVPDVCIASADGAFRHGKAAAKHAHPLDHTTQETEDHEREPASKRRKRNPLSPCGASLNWYLSSAATLTSLTVTSTVDSADPSRPSRPRKVVEVAGGTVEVTIAHTGALQGSVKKNVGEVSTSSRLSPYAMRALFEYTLDVLLAHRHDSAVQERMHTNIFRLLLPSTTNSSETQKESIDPAHICASSASLLAQVRQLSRRELKTRCGQCYYNTAKAQFLCHPVFKDWICDE